MAEQIKAGVFPAELLAACAKQQVEPGALRAWAVTAVDVQLILPNGAKVKYPLVGAWPQSAIAAAKAKPAGKPKEA